MSSNADHTNARYGVDIRGHSMHAEANDLNEIFELLAIVSGRIHVTDRVSNSLVFEGSSEDVRSAIQDSGSTSAERNR